MVNKTIKFKGVTREEWEVFKEICSNKETTIGELLGSFVVSVTNEEISKIINCNQEGVVAEKKSLYD